MAFRDQVGDWQTVTAIASGDLSDQAQMADDEPVSGVAGTLPSPALRQHIFFLRVQHAEPLDLLKVTVDAGFGLKHRPGDGAGHVGALPLVSKRNYQGRADCQVNFETLLYWP